MKNEIVKVSLRQGAIVVPANNTFTKINETTSALVAQASKMGFVFSEELLHAVNALTPKDKLVILEYLKEVTGVEKNWTPLVKGWGKPTGETRLDHIVTWFTNLVKSNKGTALACGHVIPENTFPLERYNGCPFCGTPFEFGELALEEQGSKMKVLELWTEDDLKVFFKDLLQSKTALDATQIDSLKVLVGHLELPKDVEVTIKETQMIIIQYLVQLGRASEVQGLFKTPTDVLRYLWYEHTGFLQLVEPKVIVKRIAKNNQHLHPVLDNSEAAKIKSLEDLKLKYTRKECKMVAEWLNNLPLSVAQSCEQMHPKRGMWVRMIRALRLAEYSKRKGFEKLAQLLDVFYNQKYDVWAGHVSYYKLKYDEESTFELLKERPGLFARSLFSNMLWFGDAVTLKHFSEVSDKIPARLLYTLTMYAPLYFDKTQHRMVKTLGGVSKRILPNKYLSLYRDEALKKMQVKVEELCLETLKKRFASVEHKNKTIYIDAGLYNIPLAIGDRSETIQDLPSALMGTKFELEGDTVRLFMQWGKGLKAQHLDMDLSCRVAYKNKTDFCSYSSLRITGCKHSGDIQQIPHLVGTAEYIDINVDELAKKGASYVSFTCNAYSNGSISPNLVVGWMNSKYPMRISDTTGVAYDPSCVQHQVRVTQGNAKGLVFGVLDVQNRKLIWLELPFDGQVVQNLDLKGVEALLKKLDSKFTIGRLLALKAEAQNLVVIDDKETADEVYDIQWASNTAQVTQLMLD